MRMSSVAPMKLVPYQKRNFFLTFPLMLVDRCNALINAEELKEFTTSICMALTTRHVNKTTQRFEEALPSLVLLVTIYKGQRTSTPTLVNGRAGSRLSAGRSAIFGIASSPLNVLLITHL